jgi:hypothetical protein
VCVAITVAPTTGLPSFSVTLPLIEDVVTWANKPADTNKLKTVKAKSLIVCFIND